jgi:DNA-binding transcriptional ArsR family regulator
MAADPITLTAQMFMGLSDPVRLRLVRELLNGPADVGTLTAALGGVLANVSHHLKMLKGAGLVESERAGRHVIYQLAPGVVTADTRVLQVGVTRVTFAAE